MRKRFWLPLVLLGLIGSQLFVFSKPYVDSPSDFLRTQSYFFYYRDKALTTQGIERIFYTKQAIDTRDEIKTRYGLCLNRSGLWLECHDK